MKNIIPEQIHGRIISPYSQDARLVLEKKRQNFRNNQNKIMIRPNKKENNFNPEDKKLFYKNKKTIIYSLLIIILLAVILYIVYNIWFLKQNIIVTNTGGAAPILATKNIEDLNAQMVTQDGDTRINIIIAGIGGKGHKGGSLTDSLQVLSIDPFNNQAAIISLPRDFYLTLSNKSSAKINTVYQTGESKGFGKGGALLKEEVGKILDLKIHYFVNIDFPGFEQLIDSLGGVTVDVDKAVNDPYYPDEQLEGYAPFYLKAGRQQLSGKVALKYARSRQTTSDFDRSRRQQKLMVAVKEKALSLGILANPAKISEIVKIIGSHLKTDIQVSEIQALAKRYQEIKSESTETLVVDNSKTGPLVDTNQSGSYSLIPKLGFNKYNDVQNFAHKIFPDPKVIQEAATIDIKYTKTRTADAKIILDKLSSYGYTITDNGIIKSSPAEANFITVRTTGKPFTLAYLKNRYSDFQFEKENAAENLTDLSITLVK